MTAAITKYSDLTQDDENLSKVQCLADTAIYEKADEAIEAYDKKILELATVKDAKIAPEIVAKAEKRAKKRTEPQAEIVKPMKESLKQTLSQMEATVSEAKARAKEAAAAANVQREENRAKELSDANNFAKAADALNTVNQAKTVKEEIPKEIIEDSQLAKNDTVEKKKSAKEIKSEIADTEAAIAAAQAPKRKLDIGG